MKLKEDFYEKCDKKRVDVGELYRLFDSDYG